MNEYELIFYENGVPCDDVTLIVAKSMTDAVAEFLKERNLIRAKKVSVKDIDTNCSYILIWEKGTQRDKYALYHGAYGRRYCYLVEDVTINKQAENGKKE